MTGAARIQRQAGQSLVLGMLFVGVATVAFLRYFGVSQMVAAKSRQTHALDAAAYSGAVVQTRALNMLAYLNTAQIGHQIAMAHLVTLGSWSAFGGTQARQTGVGNPPAHVIAMLFGADHGVSYTNSRRASSIAGLAKTEGQLAQAYAAHDAFVMDTFGRVQQAVVASVPAARFNTIQAVLASNYPGHGIKKKIIQKGDHINSAIAGVGVARVSSETPKHQPIFDVEISHDNWAGFVQTYSGQRRLHSFVKQVAALYGFLGPRNHTSRNNWVVDPRCPTLRHELRRRGNTQLGSDGRWQSIDTQSFHALRANRWIGCYRREYPMGWGWVPSEAKQRPDSPYVANPPDNFSAEDFWRWVSRATDWDLLSSTSNPLADSKAVAQRQRWQGSGLPAFVDINSARKSDSLHFTVALHHPGPEGLTIATQSAAESFFSRPVPRQDGRFEQNNLFHPYWQARLATPQSTPSGA